MLFVYRQAFRLDVRRTWSPFAWSLVVLETRPVKRLDEVLHGPFDVTSPVSVFDAEDEDTLVLTSEEEVVEGGSQTADVEKSGGTRSKANADGWQRSSASSGTETLSPAR
jgi:hypothetical protein